MNSTSPTPPVTIPPGPPPPTPSSPSTSGELITDAAAAGVAVAEALNPALLAFNPLFSLALVAVRAHFNATGVIMTLSQLQQAVSDDETTLTAMWATWTTSKTGGTK